MSLNINLMVARVFVIYKLIKNSFASGKRNEKEGTEN